MLVVAEHLVDVDNVGSCFRNARAFGAACVLLDDRCPDPLYRKAVRTSLGAVLEVPWAQAPIGDLLEGLATAGVAAVGLTPGGAVTLADVAAALAPDAPVALVVGNEGHGLTPETQAALTMFELQRATGQNYITLLNEISQLGIEGFLKLIDAANEEELRALLGACDVVYRQVQKYRTLPPVTG